jgi:hypothetical protein
MEIDHIYICASKNAPAGDILTAFGLIEGSPNTHPGQGTASRRFFFHNFMIELLWIENDEEALSERTRPMRLFERCLQVPDCSPFGIGFRPSSGKSEPVSFPAWDYHPMYLPDPLKIQVAENTPLNEPMFFYLSFLKRQDTVSAERREPMNHKIPLDEITSVRIKVNQKSPLSEAAVILNQLKNFTIEKSDEHLLELEFNNRNCRQCKDFRPALPLIFRW